MRKIDSSTFAGQRFGSWLVIGNEWIDNKKTKFLCRCDCGVEKFVDRSSVLSGKSTGCRKCSGMSASNNPAWSGTKDIPGNFFYICQKSAKVRNIDFNVTIDDIQALWDASGGVCALSGVPIKLGSKKLGWSASIDRIDQSKPYEAGNLQFVHKHVNIMKNRFSEDYFVDFCRKIVSRHNLA